MQIMFSYSNQILLGLQTGDGSSKDSTRLYSHPCDLPPIQNVGYIRD
jgi:hypothetical protein